MVIEYKNYSLSSDIIEKYTSFNYLHIYNISDFL